MIITITEKLYTIAREQQIKILYACESGSRGWEFPSPDSDYDVRFIYIRPQAAYLSILNQKDNLSFPVHEELDIYGWDLRKVLQLVYKSNTTPFEWLQSPLIYMEQPGFRQALWQLCPQYFSRRGNIRHYLGIAAGALQAMNNRDELSIKKLFYVIRSLLSAQWCLENNGIAPMRIGPLMTLLPGNLQQQVKELIQLKATTAESFMIPVDPDLKGYIDQQLTTCSAAAKELKNDQFEWPPLDILFKQTITDQ